MNMFLSLSDNTCLTNVIPVPMRTIVMNKTDPLSLKKINKNCKITNALQLKHTSLTNVLYSKQRPM